MKKSKMKEKCPAPSAPKSDGYGPLPDRGPRNLSPHMDRAAKKGKGKGK